MDEKLAAIEQNKLDLISAVKQASAKLKFTLNGSVARDIDYLNTSLQTSRERLASLGAATDSAIRVLGDLTSDCPQINVCCLSSAKSTLSVSLSLFMAAVSHSECRHFSEVSEASALLHSHTMPCTDARQKSVHTSNL